MAHDLFFVNIEAPVETRKQLLESSTLILDVFKRYEKYKQITQGKLRQMQELRMLVDEIKSLNKELLSHLPKIHLQNQGQMPQEEPIPGVDRHQLQKLEADIKGIEDQLNALE